MLVAQGTVGGEGELSAEQGGSRALGLEHVEQVTVPRDVAAEPARGGEGEIGDAVPGCEFDQLGGMRADLLLSGGRQMGRLGEWLAHTASLRPEPRLRHARNARYDPVPLENRIRQVTCGSSVRQAAWVYSLIRPPRTGFRRIRRVSMSVTVDRATSGSSSGTR